MEDQAFISITDIEDGRKYQVDKNLFTTNYCKLLWNCASRVVLTCKNGIDLIIYLVNKDHRSTIQGVIHDPFFEMSIDIDIKSICKLLF